MDQNIAKPNQVFRILLDPKSYRILLRDMDLFEITKISTFINRIITNYYETYQRSTFSFYRIKNLIKEKTGIGDVLANKVVEDIYKEFQLFQPSNEKSIKSISIRPNSESESVFSLITQSLDQIHNHTVGFVIKSILIEYTKLSRLERERIMYKDQINIFHRAIKENLKLIIETNNVTRVVYPGTIIEPLDDYGNYLLVYNEMSNKMDALLLRGVKKMYPNGEHFTHKKAVMELIKTYQNKDFSILTEIETEALQVLLSKNNLNKLHKILMSIEKKGNFRFERLSEETISAALPELKRQKIGLTQDELDELPNKS
jgi:hypothetical protein